MFEYKQHSKYEAAFNPERCKASVAHGGRMIGFHQCCRKPVLDGWCKQHHPDAEAARNAASLARWEADRVAREASRQKAAAGQYRAGYDAAVKRLGRYTRHDENCKFGAVLRDETGVGRTVTACTCRLAAAMKGEE